MDWHFTVTRKLVRTLVSGKPKEVPAARAGIEWGLYEQLRHERCAAW